MGVFTSVQVKELPTNEISLTDNFVHEVGDVLSRSTIQELVNFIKSQSTTYQYEIKTIRAINSTYITDNFDMTVGATQGLGKSTGIWNGWAICNGNNGTDNLDGQTFIGYGANYNTVGQFVGSADAVVVEHSHNIRRQNKNASNSGSERVLDNTGTSTIYSTTESTGVSGTGKNIQPSMVILKIMKL